MILFRVVLIASGTNVIDLFAAVRVVLTMAVRRARCAHFSVKNVLRWGRDSNVVSVVFFPILYYFFFFYLIFHSLGFRDENAAPAAYVAHDGISFGEHSRSTRSRSNSNNNNIRNDSVSVNRRR